MKFLKITGIVIGVLLILFFGMGFLRPEITYDSEVTVNKPIDEVWAVSQDESRISEWLKEVKRIEHVSGEPGTVGAVSKIYVDQNGEEMFMTETITAVEPKKRMAMTFTMDFMDMDYEMIFTEKGESTHVSSHTVTRGNGMFAKSLMAIIGGTMKDQEDLNMNNMKTLIENNTKVYN